MAALRCVPRTHERAEAEDDRSGVPGADGSQELEERLEHNNRLKKSIQIEHNYIQHCS